MAQNDDTIAKTGPQTPCRKRKERASAEGVDELDAVPTPLKIQKKNVGPGYVLIVYCVIMNTAHNVDYTPRVYVYTPYIAITVFASSSYPIRDIVYEPVDTIEPCLVSCKYTIGSDVRITRKTRLAPKVTTSVE